MLPMATLAAVLALPALAAAAVLHPRVDSAPSPWVTVDASGSAVTITPTVSKGSTISAPPSQLTHSATYVLVVSSSTTTKTAAPAVATAATSSGAGAFLTCSNYQGYFKPFCQPGDGSELAPGSSYYVTWDTTFFYTGATVEIGVQYNTTGSVSDFASKTIDASQGFYVWTIESSFLTTLGASSVDATIYASYTDTSNNAERATGPAVVITSAKHSLSSGHHVSALAVALPVVLGLAAIVLLCFCAWSWRRYGRVLPCCGGGGRRDAAGNQNTRTTSFLQQQPRMGVSTVVSHDAVGGSGKAEPAAATDIQLTDRDSWSPTHGTTNVFRAELRRQEAESKQG
ncbi:hypothetical protein CMQ_3762 [Grosmannia clavigera kw1407]|uniref:Uncharacterized protein n=1 Tax=Grosmannia clavigera (strain kw1407 / UAMH 11150) TaxID=655863 RepID=F0X8Q1_GROCL|nr:uncharacterized protein CMQ_3762 [Grosmannia clavigera kw1407]EFX05693.1 hypothetical protein CMQ_3762 [Grosmannia clavigera kw1407]